MVNGNGRPRPRARGKHGEGPPVGPVALLLTAALVLACYGGGSDAPGDGTAGDEHGAEAPDGDGDDDTAATEGDSAASDTADDTGGSVDPPPRIVINELHVNPDLAHEAVEFIELTNIAGEDVDLSGWRFSQGVQFEFPAGTMLPDGGVLVVAQAPEQLRTKYGAQALGPYARALSGDGEEVTLIDDAGAVADTLSYGHGFPWPTVGEIGRSMQLLNPEFDGRVGGNWRGAEPTPGLPNAGLTDDAPPRVRQVIHTPAQPTAADAVTITATITDAESDVIGVTVDVQVVEPGQYVKKSDAAYEDPANWTSMTMTEAGDGTFTATVAAGTVPHRGLLRYRVRAEDGAGQTVQVPYIDDAGGNFAVFVYDGVPDYAAGGEVYDAAMLGTLPVYHLITTEDEIIETQWSGDTTKEFLGEGTLVYDGVVYDHVVFRSRGGSFRYERGKNQWKIKFPRGHEFVARDNWGIPYRTPWRVVNFGRTMHGNGGLSRRGEDGIYEAASYAINRLAGMPSGVTHWVHFRVIDDASGTGADQYGGDFWGTQIVVEDFGGRYLREHDLPDGNLYKAGSDYEMRLQSQGTFDFFEDGSDRFMTMLNAGRATAVPRSWYEEHVDIDSYLTFRAVIELVRDADINYVSATQNYGVFHNPLTDRWQFLPWDRDHSWWNVFFEQPRGPFTVPGEYFLLDAADGGFRPEFASRIRHIRDLLYNDDEGHRLIDELAMVLGSTHGTTHNFAEADRALWDNHPRTEDPGEYNDFIAIGPEHMKTWMLQDRDAYIDALENDSAIPATPTISYAGTPGYPPDGLRFGVSSFDDPQGADTMAAMQWRIGEIRPAVVGEQRPRYEIEAVWLREVEAFEASVDIPSGVVQSGSRYRARARMMDDTRRWSHWSAPVEFVGGR